MQLLGQLEVHVQVKVLEHALGVVGVGSASSALERGALYCMKEIKRGALYCIK